MAENNARVVDLTQTFGQLVADNAELAAFLAEMGFEDVDAAKTLPQAAAEAGVDLSIVAMALGAAGYDVEGYVPTEDAKNSPLESIITELANSEPAEASADPMVAHMEYAIRRAQNRGDLPK